MPSRVATLYRTPTRIPRSAARYIGRGMRLGTGRSPMVLRSGRAIGMYNPYVRAGLITAAALSAARMGLKKRGPIKEAFRSYSRPKRTPIPSKSKQSYIKELGNLTGTLYTEIVDLPDQGVNPQQRRGDIIYLSGIKLCLEFTNLLNNDLYLNVALLQSRDNPSSKGAVTGSKFFRDTAGSNRGVDFPLPLSIQNHCRPINVDLFRVFMHQRMKLGGEGTIPAYTVRNSVKTIMKYIPFKKQLRFDASNFTKGQLQLVFWADKESSDTVPTTPAAFDLRGEMVVYFREPKGQ